jgi:hypothetical protein
MTTSIIPDLPKALVRDKNNESELTKMAKGKVEVARAPDSALAADEADAPARKPVKAKANGHAKEAKPSKVGKPAKVAKPAKAAKAEKPAKAPKEAKAERKERTVDPAKLDKFGFRKGSIKSNAAAIYAKGKGATLAEVKEAVGSNQFNLLTEVEARGHTVQKTSVDGEGNRKVTRYKITAKTAE